MKQTISYMGKIGERIRRTWGIIMLCVLIFGVHLGSAQQPINTGDPDNLVVPAQETETNSETEGGEEEERELTDSERKQIQQQWQQYKEEMISGWESQLIYKEAHLIKRKRDLEKNLTIFSDSDTNIQEYQRKLEPLSRQIGTLEGQLAYLDEQMALTQYKVSNITQQIIQKQEEIRQNMEDVERAKLEVQNQEKILIEYAKLIYDHDQKYYDFETRSFNDIKLFLSEDPISKNITSSEYLRVIQETGQSILEELVTVHIGLAEKELELELSQDRLQLLKTELVRQKQVLGEEQEAKEYLLEVTKGEESLYKELLAQNEQQKAEASQEIEMLQGSIGDIEKELEELRSKAKNVQNPQSESIQKKAESAATLLETQKPPEEKIKRFPWPIDTSRGLSAYFDDANYRQIFGVDHRAVDVPAPQGSDIRAVADAYVYKAKDNGFGYSYIVLAHKKGFITVYGHVSKIMVKEGDLIEQGQVIGLSGGAPGTRGAGLRTTGAHLHFEIWRNGKQVDPLIYMDLSELPMERVRQDKIPETQEDVGI